MREGPQCDGIVCECSAKIEWLAEAPPRNRSAVAMLFPTESFVDISQIAIVVKTFLPLSVLQLLAFAHTVPFNH